MNNIPWNRKYRPARLDDLVLTSDNKAWVESIIASRVIPNMTLYSEQPGIGKTTIALLIAKFCCGEDDVLVINGSLDRGIDTIRNQMIDFITAATLSAGKKCIIIDEADSMNPLTLPALRAFMEEWDREVSFILTCNDLSKFEDVKNKPILSRCPVHDLTIVKGRDKLYKQMYERLASICRLENVEFEKTDLQNLIVDYYPDMRMMISNLQSASLTGTFCYKMVQQGTTFEVDISTIMSYLKAVDYPQIRKWCKTYCVLPNIYDIIYDQICTKITKEQFDEVVLLIGKYAYEAGLSSSKEITLTACLIELGKYL